MGKHSLLFVFAHPDDETTVGGLIARYASAGHDVHLVSITSGQRGVRPHFGMPAGEGLGSLREEEVRAAARELGVRKPFLLGFEDQGIASMAAAGQAAARVREIVSETRADLIVTFGPDGLTGHPDHRAAGDIATVVFQEQARLAHKPRKLYYVLFPESRFLDDPDPLHRNRPFLTVSDAFVTTEIDCREWLEAGARALRCHKTQFTPKRMDELAEFYSRVLGGRTFLRLALTTLDCPRTRESCLLEGLGPPPVNPS